MARWEPDGRARLERAALDLFAEHGYDRTTVHDIADRAGLTQRTFFRHYADKREVLFAGGQLLQDTIIAGVRTAPLDVSPLDAVLAGVRDGAALLDKRRDFAVQRQAIIDAHPELQERELIKMAKITAAVADTLRGRGVADTPAALAAQVAIAVFRTAFARWVRPSNRIGMVTLLKRTRAQLPAVVL